MFSSGKGNFDKLIDKSTSQLLLEPDWNSILQICDCIRQRDVQPKYAFATIRKKIVDKNPRGSLYALQVLESCVKNCGIEFNEEISNKLFMEELKELASSGNEELKNKVLELIQAWGTAFRNEPKMKMVVDMYNLLKLEGHAFPPVKESEAMFSSEKAPEWIDGDKCFSCRTEFGITVRKHHCRHCGQIFCSKCTSKQCTIPKFGIEREVRVCDSCFISIPNATSKTTSSTSTSTSKEPGDLPPEYLASPLSQQSQLPVRKLPPQKNEREMQEQEELELALALSLDAAENKHLINDKSVAPSPSTTASSYSAPATTSTPYTPSVVDQEMDPELARYLNRPYWEQKQDIQATPSAPEATPATAPPATAPPISQSTSQPVYATVNKIQEQPVQNGDDEKYAFLSALSASIDTFNNRMNSNSMRGRSIASDSTVQSLFMQISSMHPQLLTMMQELEDGRANMEALQDKLAQIKDAREALDALREDHREKLRQEAEEAERQRQIQLAQKLEIMRQKKQEYLQYQRQIAMQRLQEQEREMQMRLEQQKYHQQMRQMQYMPSGMGMPPQGMMPGMAQHGMMSQGMQPGMTHQPGIAGMQQPPQGMQQPPQGMQQPPQGMQQPPQGMQQPPQGMQQPPQGMQQPPQGMQQPPQGIQQPAQGMQQPPQGMQQPPQGMQQPPQGMQQPPQGMQQPPQGMQQPPQGMQQPPQGMAPQSMPPQGMQQQPQYGQTFNPPSSMHGSPSHTPYQQQHGQPPQQTMEQSIQRPAVPPVYNQPPPQYQAQQPSGLQGPAAGYQPMQYQNPQQFGSPHTSLEYTQANPYNMQNMANALPQGSQPYSAPQGQMYHQQGGEIPPQVQVPQQVPQPAEASLISFD